MRTLCAGSPRFRQDSSLAPVRDPTFPLSSHHPHQLLGWAALSRGSQALTLSPKTPTLFLDPLPMHSVTSSDSFPGEARGTHASAAAMVKYRVSDRSSRVPYFALILDPPCRARIDHPHGPGRPAWPLRAQHSAIRSAPTPSSPPCPPVVCRLASSGEIRPRQDSVPFRRPDSRFRQEADVRAIDLPSSPTHSI